MGCFGYVFIEYEGMINVMKEGVYNRCLIFYFVFDMIDYEEYVWI